LKGAEFDRAAQEACRTIPPREHGGNCDIKNLSKGSRVYGPIEPRYSEYLVFEGISVDEFTGKQYYLDAHVAYRCACLNAIEYFKKFGYTGEQVYLLLGSAPVEGRISGIVDIPNACCTIAVPTAIFERNVLPS
jgi:formamidase